MIWIGIAILAVIAFVLIVGMFPMSIDGFDPNPQPVSDYDMAIEMVKQQEEEAPITKEVSRSILLTHGEKTEDVYVLVHGVTIAAWMAQNREEVDRAGLMSPFIGLTQTPMFLDTFLMNAFVHLPDISVGDSSEKRDWVCPGESSRSLNAYMQLGQSVIQQTQKTPPLADRIFVLTTASDDAADNGWTKKLVGAWQAQGVNVAAYEFPKEEKVPHASIDPGTDQAIRELVYSKILG